MQNLKWRWLTFFSVVCVFSPVLAWQRPDLASADAVRLVGTWAAVQLHSADRLNQPPLNGPDFILDDVTLKEPRRLFAQYSGDLSGRWIDDAAFLEPRFPQDFASLSVIMAQLPYCQHGDGHFGTKQDLSKLVRSRDMPILWGNGRMLVGLVELYEQTTNVSALEIAKKLGDYFVSTDSIYDKAENIQKIGGSYADGFETCYFSCIEGLACLARVTGDARYLEEAERIAGLALTISNFDGLHCHGRLTTLRGIADIYEITHENRWLQGVERDWKTFKDKYLLPTGGFKEVLAPKCSRDEGCAEADWVRLNLSLWRLTGNARYLDAAEYCLHNHFIYQQFPDGGSGHRIFRQIDGRPVSFDGLSQEAWWCCCEHWPRALSDVACSAVAANGGHIFINLDVDCDAAIAGPGGLWKIALRKVNKDLKIRLNPANPTPAVICIHRPDWALRARVEAPEGFAVQVESNQWVITGKWDRLEKINVLLDPILHVEKTGRDSGVFRLGYDLLAAAPNPANNWMTDKLPSTRPVILWSAALAMAKDGIRVPASLSSSADPDKPSQWHILELSSLRTQASNPQHQIAWFSFRPRESKAGCVKALLNKIR